MLTTTPIVDLIQVASTVMYMWEKDGKITVNELTLGAGVPATEFG